MNILRIVTASLLIIATGLAGGLGWYQAYGSEDDKVRVEATAFYGEARQASLVMKKTRKWARTSRRMNGQALVLAVWQDNDVRSSPSAVAFVFSEYGRPHRQRRARGYRHTHRGDQDSCESLRPSSSFFWQASASARLLRALQTMSRTAIHFAESSLNLFR